MQGYCNVSDDSRWKLQSRTRRRDGHTYSVTRVTSMKIWTHTSSTDRNPPLYVGAVPYYGVPTSDKLERDDMFNWYTSGELDGALKGDKWRTLRAREVSHWRCIKRHTESLNEPYILWCGPDSEFQTAAIALGLSVEDKRPRRTLHRARPY